MKNFEHISTLILDESISDVLKIVPNPDSPNFLFVRIADEKSSPTLTLGVVNVGSEKFIFSTSRISMLLSRLFDKEAETAHNTMGLQSFAQFLNQLLLSCENDVLFLRHVLAVAASIKYGDTLNDDVVILSNLKDSYARGLSPEETAYFLNTDFQRLVDNLGFKINSEEALIILKNKNFLSHLVAH